MTGSTSASAGWDQSPERGEGNPAAVETGGGSKGTVSPQEASPADSPQQSPFPPGFPGCQEPGEPQGREVWGAGGGVQGDLGAGVPLCARRWGAAALGSGRGSRGLLHGHEITLIHFLRT